MVGVEHAGVGELGEVAGVLWLAMLYIANVLDGLR